MQLKLSDNIKKYRKKMDLTQEGLADALGVTVGAVSKWENGNNVPDVMTMMELADFFSISMDELLGFSLSSKKIDDMCNEIDILARHHQFDEAIRISKDAMVRYPYTFKVLCASADIYYYKFLEGKEKKDSEEAIGIFEKALNCISQSEEKEMMEYIIKIKMAYLQSFMDRPEMMEENVKKAFELAIRFDEAGIGENIFTGVKYNYCRKEKIKAYDTTGTKAIDSIGKMIEKKLEDTSGKNKEKIQRVLDSWERLCAARAII
ncbi:MAG: helix-turn-helix domain-containing protein [Lachnospiraceae bacterium]|nr:helix-turn-helix domain-containing protein [Lachnospiraceae bacterium]